MRFSARGQHARIWQVISSKKLSPFRCGQVVSKFILQGQGKSRLLESENLNQGCNVMIPSSFLASILTFL